MVDADLVEDMTVSAQQVQPRGFPALLISPVQRKPQVEHSDDVLFRSSSSSSSDDDDMAASISRSFNEAIISSGGTGSSASAVSVPVDDRSSIDGADMRRLRRVGILRKRAVRRLLSADFAPMSRDNSERPYVAFQAKVVTEGNEWSGRPLLRMYRGGDASWCCWCCCGAVLPVVTFFLSLALIGPDTKRGQATTIVVTAARGFVR